MPKYCSFYVVSFFIDSMSIALSSLAYILRLQPHLHNHIDPESINSQWLFYIITNMQNKENSNPNAVNRDRNQKGNKSIAEADEVGKKFCYQCLEYNCGKDWSKRHEEHKVGIFSSANEARQNSKQALLLEVQSTLGRLKGKENELKNQMEEVSLIKIRLSAMANEIISVVKQQLQQLQTRVQQKLKTQFEKYQRELDTFYREYNSVNDYLRDNLLRIIDGQIDPTNFNRHNVSRDLDPSAMPQFGKMKQVMQQCKKYLRNVKQSTKELQNSIKFFSNEEQKQKLKFEKYDKFLKQKSTHEEASSHLIRTLSIIENNQFDLTMFRSKLRH